MHFPPESGSGQGLTPALVALLRNEGLKHDRREIHKLKRIDTQSNESV
jgi:hypothetical protein